MKRFNTLDYTLTSQLDTLSQDEAYWFYSGADSCITEEIRRKLTSQLDEVTRPLYAHTMRMQAPILEMMLRGIKVNLAHRDRAIKTVREEIQLLRQQLNSLCTDGLGIPAINPGSPVQVKHLFYTVLGLKEVKKRNSAGAYAASSNRESLELLNQYFIAQPFVSHILALRDRQKILGFLNTPLDADGRIRCALNLAGTDTGRLSSSFSDFGTGTNLQNVDRNLRYIFVADEGKIFVNIDLEQADSRNVGALCWHLFYASHGEAFAGNYLNACESGDLHTSVCRLAWTQLPWGTDPIKWRSVADQIAYRTYTYRDMAKKLGHGSNYYGQPPTMAAHAKLPVRQVATFQSNYFSSFPEIPEWHKWTINELQTKQELTHLFGRRRHFWDDPKKQSTINAAIASSPQGMTGEEVNHGILNIWSAGFSEMLIQVHDSILFQVPIRKVNTLVPQALELMRVPITLAGGRRFEVPCEAKTGYNWGDFDPDTNPSGMKKWKGEETRQPPKATNALLSALK